MNLNTCLQLTYEQVINTKIHFAIGASNKKEPLLEFFKDKFKEWQEYQNKRNFERTYILSLIYYCPDEWLFAGFYRSISVSEEADHFRYNTELLPTGKELIGRLIIEYKKEYRQSYVYCENYINDLEVTEIMRSKASILPFGGYESILIDFETLKAIVSKEETSWKTALSNVKGVYLITDRTNGKQYVGSSYGEETFWQRWSSYANTGHGNNQGLRKILEEKGYEHSKNFQFSILEIRSITTDKDEIIKRETHWKNILMTKEYGYNEN